MPIKVYDSRAQREVEVSAAEAQRGIQQGDYSPIAGQRLRFAKGNRIGTAAPEDALTAIGQGARLVDDEEAARIKLEREESTTASQALATAEAAAAGVSLGASTFLEKELFGVDPERMAARREAAGPVATGAEIAGAALPALITGGSTAPLSGGARAGTGIARLAAVTPSGFVARQAARFGEGIAARTGTGVASKILPVAGREFVEGAAQGIGAQIDEDVLGDRELAADRLGSAGLIGGLFGVGAGLGVTGLAKVADGTVRAPIAGLRKVLGRSNAASGGMASREVAEMVADQGVARDLSPQAKLWKRNAIAQGIDPDAADRLARMGDSAEGRRDILRLERDRPKIEREAAELVADRVPKIHAAMDEARRLANGESKARYWERLGPNEDRGLHLEGGDVSLVESRRAAAGETDSLFLSHKGELAKLAEENQYALREFGGGLPYNSTVLYQARSALATFERELVEARNLSGRAVSTKVAMAADRYKREIGQIIEDNGGWGAARHVDPDVRVANRVMRQRYDEVRAHLERRDLWGGAAEAQADINAAYVRYANADAAYRDATAGTGLGGVVNPDGSFNGFKAIKLVRAHGRTGGDVAVARLMDALDARVAYFDKVAKYVDMDDAGHAALRSVKEETEALRKEFKRQAVDAGKLDDLIEARKVEGNGSPSLLTTGTSLASLIGFGVGGPLGAIGGAAIVAARQPHTTLHRYAAIMNALDKVDVRLDGVVSRMFSRTGDVKAPSLPKLPKLPTGVVGQFSRKEHDDRREKALAKATDYLGSSEALAQALTVPLYDVPPAIASTIQERAQVAASFLQAKAPKVYSRGKTKLVDPVSAASFARYLEAVVDPIGALERFESGRITRETAEAIRIVYPALFLDIQERIQTEMARAQDEGREIPYDKRVRWGMMFQTTTDPSLVATTAVELQLAIGADYDEPSASQVMAAGKTNKPGKLESSGAEGMQTAGDRAASWRST